MNDFKWQFIGRCLRVVDGDTLRVGGGGMTSVKLELGRHVRCKFHQESGESLDKAMRDISNLCDKTLQGKLDGYQYD